MVSDDTGIFSESARAPGDGCIFYRTGEYAFSSADAVCVSVSVHGPASAFLIFWILDGDYRITIEYYYEL